MTWTKENPQPAEWQVMHSEMRRQLSAITSSTEPADLIDAALAVTAQAITANVVAMCEAIEKRTLIEGSATNGPPLVRVYDAHREYGSPPRRAIPRPHDGTIDVCIDARGNDSVMVNGMTVWPKPQCEPRTERERILAAITTLRAELDGVRARHLKPSEVLDLVEKAVRGG